MAISNGRFNWSPFLCPSPEGMDACDLSIPVGLRERGERNEGEEATKGGNQAKKQALEPRIHSGLTVEGMVPADDMTMIEEED